MDLPFFCVKQHYWGLWLTLTKDALIYILYKSTNKLGSLIFGHRNITTWRQGETQELLVGYKKLIVKVQDIDDPSLTVKIKGPKNLWYHPHEFPRRMYWFLYHRFLHHNKSCDIRMVFVKVVNLLFWQAVTGFYLLNFLDYFNRS